MKVKFLQAICLKFSSFSSQTSVSRDLRSSRRIHCRSVTLPDGLHSKPQRLLNVLRLEEKAKALLRVQPYGSQLHASYSLALLLMHMLAAFSLAIVKDRISLF
jgi:hypothetical protein